MVVLHSRLIVSGGRDGQVRVWEITKNTQRMLASMKEHKGTVNCVQCSADDTKCLSASDDGACIIWDLVRFARDSAMFASTQFKVRCRVAPRGCFHRLAERCAPLGC